MPLVLGALGSVSILIVSWRYGLGTSNDGVLYLSAAHHLLEGSGLTDFRGDPLVIFPPLFPALIAAFGTVVGSVETAARCLQMLLYAGNFLLAGALLLRLVQDRLIVAAILVILLVSRTFLLYHYYVLSEPLFVFMTLGTLLLLCRWTTERRDILIAGAAIFTALSCLTRYVGVANTLTGVLVIILVERGWARKCRSAGLFSVISLAPLGFWLVRNSLATGSLTGNRLPSPYPILLNLRLVADGISIWFVPDEVYPWLRVVLVVIAGAACAIALWRMRIEDGDAQAQQHSLLVAAVVAHVIVLVVATSLFASDYVTTRFVMPVYVPVVILVASVLSWMTRRVARAGPAVVVILVVWISIQLFTSARLVLDRHERGVGGYATRDWRESDVMAFVRDHADELGTDTYSNAALGVYFGASVVANFLPDRINPRWAENYPARTLTGRPTMDDLTALTESADRTVILIWFDNAAPDVRYESLYLFNQYSLEDLRREFRTVEIAGFTDGGVYLLLPKAPLDLSQGPST